MIRNINLWMYYTLSRAFLSDQGLKSDVEFEEQRKSQFKKEIQNDYQLKLVKTFCERDWSANQHQIPDCVKHFAKIKNEVVIVDELLFFGNKLIVPLSLRAEMLSLLHEGHIGIEKTKMRARNIFYWPGLSTDIELFIKKCKTCEKTARKNHKEKLLPHPIPQRPWERLGVDIFTNFKVITRSPNYPRSNGLAEKGVGISKNLLKKAAQEGSDVYSALLQYRNSPLKHIGYSPSQLLMSRICKPKVPVLSDLLSPESCSNVQEKLKLRQHINKTYFDKSARDLKPLESKYHNPTIKKTQISANFKQFRCFEDKCLPYYWRI
ncbi:Integrase zinc binding domain [Popillia japonica]|uniref:RNA-directed DNA polymerase n=1 Tax=Popillia japonica TaxID=7064 RepID=A0AAW1HTR0_POPJA